MATETKIGFLLILVLLGALSFVVYKKWEKNQAAVAISPAAEEQAGDTADLEQDPFGEPISTEQQPPTPVEQEAVDFDALVEAQSEPQFQSQPTPVQTVAQAPPDWGDAGGDPFAQSAQQQTAEQQTAQVPQADAADEFFPAEQQAVVDQQPAWGTVQEPPPQQDEPESEPIDLAQQPNPEQFAEQQFEPEPQPEQAQVTPAPAEDDAGNPFADLNVEQSEPVVQQQEPAPVGDAGQEFGEPAGEDPFASVEVAQAQPTETTVQVPNVLHQHIVQQGWDAADAAQSQNSPAPQQQHRQHSMAQQQAPFGGNFDQGTQYRKRPGHHHPHRGEDVSIYVVRPRDTYWNISQQVYGTPRYYAGLARYNRHRIPRPQTMRRGMKVMVPDVEVLVAHYPDLYPSSQNDQAKVASGFFADASGRPAYRVGRKDTLTSIAQRHLGRSSRWIQIYQMNRDRVPNPKTLQVGTVLRLPLDASQVRLASDPAFAQ